jgi:hypothetical protein
MAVFRRMLASAILGKLINSGDQSILELPIQSVEPQHHDWEHQPD